MDFSAVALLAFAALVLGGVLLTGVAALVHVRTGRRERLIMKRHVQRLEVTGRD
jgi:hypothetical protein